MEWISVKDRLPDHKTQCIGYFEVAYSYGFNINEVFYNDGRWFWDLDSIENITHWMPLPEPPKQIKI